MNILRNTKMGEFFGRGPMDNVMSKADRVLGRTPGSSDGSREIHSSSKAERMLGIGQYDTLSHIESIVFGGVSFTGSSISLILDTELPFFF